MRTPVVLTTALLVAALTGCGGTTPGSGADPNVPDGGVDTTPGPSSSAPASPSPSVSLPSGPTDGAVPPALLDDPRVKAALADAKGRAGIVPTEVEVSGYTPVTWNDGSLGCPKPGESYTQMTVEGELLVIRADQRLMEYHAAKDGDFTYCATPSDGYTTTR